MNYGITSGFYDVPMIGSVIDKTTRKSLEAFAKKRNEGLKVDSMELALKKRALEKQFKEQIINQKP